MPRYARSATLPDIPGGQPSSLSWPDVPLVLCDSMQCQTSAGSCCIDAFPWCRLECSLGGDLGVVYSSPSTIVAGLPPASIVEAMAYGLQDYRRLASQRLWRMAYRTTAG